MFTARILQRGKEYYRQNRVSIFHREANTVAAEVRGSRRYFVEIDRYEDDYFDMSCTCAYAADGHNCKHMAAVLYGWLGASNRTDGRRALLVDPEVRLFEESDFPDAYFNPGRITAGYTFHQRLADNARTLAESGAVTLDRVRLQYYPRLYDDDVKALEVTGSAHADHEQQTVRLVVSKDTILSGTCALDQRSLIGLPVYDSDRICVHETALLYLLADYIRRYNPGDETNRQGEFLLHQFGRLRADRQQSEAAAPEEIITLEPKLTRTHVLQLSFRIGTGKMYVVRNLTDLVHAVREKESMHLGKNQDLHFQYETFTPEARKYYDFIAGRVNEALTFSERMQNRYGGLGDLLIRGEIELSGSSLDQFYDITEGKIISFDDKTDAASHGTIRIGGGSWTLALCLEPLIDEDRFKGVVLRGPRISLLHGTRDAYYIADGTLSRFSPEEYEAIRPFAELSEDGDIRVEIGRSNLPEFYYRILPRLRDNPLIELDESALEPWLGLIPPEARFSFYLDIENHDVSCRIEADYDGSTVIVQDMARQADPLPVWRDAVQEQRTIDTVKTYFPYYAGNAFHQQEDDDLIYELLSAGLRDLMAIGEVHVSEAFSRLRIRRTPMVRFGVSVESSIMALDITTSGLSADELLAVLDSYRRKKKYHRLKSGEFIALEENESLDVLAAMMDDMHLSVHEFTEGKLHLPAYRALYVEKLLEDHEEIAARRDRSFRELIHNFNAVRDNEYEVPASLKDVLRSYQVYGYQWLRTLADCGFGGILGDDMGLGKTVQMIAFLAGLQQDDKLDKPALIVCPASVVYNWQEEFQRFAPELRVLPAAGTISARKKILATPDIDVFITSYDLLKRDIGLYTGMDFSVIVLDEAQFIKNARAAVSRSVKVLKARHRFALTGTPIENRLSELWSIFDFLMPGFLYTYDLFRSRYENAITRDKDEVMTKRLRQMTAPFILRRFKEDVLKDLPEKLEEIRYARFGEKQQRLYDAQVTHMRQMLKMTDEADSRDKIRILAELTRIRQICCDPSLLLEDWNDESAKREACLDLIRSAMDGGHKMLVFSQFAGMLELLGHDLEQEGIRYYTITGATPKEKRLQYVHAFNRDDTPVFLISLKAGGTGLNLTGADVVIHYDPWWNLAVQNQATDRAHRIGQTRKVNVFKLIVKDSIEERILEMQNTKKDLADAILSGENTALTSLSAEELLALLT